MKCRQFVDYAQRANLCHQCDSDVPSVCTSLCAARNCVVSLRNSVYGFRKRGYKNVAPFPIRNAEWTSIETLTQPSDILVYKALFRGIISTSRLLLL